MVQLLRKAKHGLHGLIIFEFYSIWLLLHGAYQTLYRGPSRLLFPLLDGIDIRHRLLVD
jgi:hypothetical protein